MKSLTLKFVLTYPVARYKKTQKYLGSNEYSLMR